MRPEGLRGVLAAVADGELKAFGFFTEADAAGRLRDHFWNRVQAALTALRTGEVIDLQNGKPAR